MIEVKDLSFSYPGGEPAVQGIDFRVDAGEIFGFLGPNGAGKSTTQKILVGLLGNFEGDVSVLGSPMDEWGNDFYEHIGVAFEFPNHYLKLTGKENLTYFGALYEGETRSASDLLEAVDLSKDADVPASQYSKGMKSRLSIARSLLNNPEVLFLDEPTTGLDPVSARRIKGLIRQEKAKGTTVFLTTHDMVVAEELCDRVAFIVDGRVTLIDTPRNLKLEHGNRRVGVEVMEDGRLLRSEFELDGLADDPRFPGVHPPPRARDDSHTGGVAGGDLRPGHRKDPRMSRLAAAIRCDVRIQVRNGFYWAVAFLMTMLLLVIRQLPPLNWTPVVPPLILGNLALGTFFFMAGLVLLEKAEGTLQPLVVTPLRVEEYLVSKVATLTTLGLVEHVIIALVMVGTAFRALPLVTGVVIAASLYCLAAFAAVARYDSINEMMLPTILWVTLFSLPILHYAGLWSSPLMYLHPFQAPLVVLRGTVTPLAAWEWLYGIGYGAVWVGGAFLWSRRSFQRFIVSPGKTP